ncbi:nuclease-related domain-containing protein [Bacillus sp. S/N-304-OC-R1]|uniref:nuclease-related domain-containing protein n=1 Tax=Bacillus sp. S/N-304-OC-R1 TaxID=2758034 RepID=UPI001C8E2C26|nr:nuclease-related domain-containing protein [Bacillus sp. S/N-304-OC-R1]MBY0121438.1 NERD domain-containing protein [Bacillus sp. S/N-304-OC-R1]
MNFKKRREPEELTELRYLNKRMNLSEADRNQLAHSEKGYKGELQFDEWMKKIPDDWLILNDLLLESNSTLFQIDTLVISPETMYIFEIKNNEGDHYLEGDLWFTASNKEINNPMIQINRSESLLRRLLKDLGFKTSIESFVCFINPEFFLYQAPRNLPIIYLPQLPRFIQRLNSGKSQINASHMSLAEKLVTLHIPKSPYKRTPSYRWEELRKGIPCRYCHSFMEESRGEYFMCRQCGEQEKTASSILRNIEEFELLFPEKKITTLVIYEWCGGVRSKRSIRRILQKEYTMVGGGRHSYFIGKKD